MAERRATYEDLVALPEHINAELVDGRVYTFPWPGVRCATAMGRLLSRLVPAFDSEWVIVFKPELRLLEDVLIPDLAGWRIERAPHPDTDFIDIVPDWICEILAPVTEQFDRVRKTPLYLRHGVRFMWLLDPLHRILEIKQPQSGHWMDLASFTDGVIRAAPFDAIEIDLEKIWGSSPLPAP